MLLNIDANKKGNSRCLFLLLLVVFLYPSNCTIKQHKSCSDIYLSFLCLNKTDEVRKQNHYNKQPSLPNLNSLCHLENL